MHVGFLDHRHQRPLGRPAGLEEAGEVGAAPQLRDAQLDRAGARLPVPLPVAVALHQAVRAALAMAGAGHPADLQLHQPLGRKADHLPQQGGIRPFRQQLAKGSLVLGHRGVPGQGL